MRTIRVPLLLGLCLLVSMSSALAGEKVKIGFILGTTQEERYQKDKAYFLEEAGKLGASVVFDSCDNSERVQTTKVENILSKGIRALVIQPVNSDAAAPLVEAAHKAGIPVIAYDRIINNADLDYYVTQDSYRVGVLQSEAAVLAIGGKGNVVILSGQAGHSVAKEITRGNLDVLKKYKDIVIVSQQSHDGWSGSKAMATVENVLAKYKNDIQAILANNSGMANGAVQALEAEKLTGKVFVAGSDSDLAAIRNIVAGKQQFEVLKAIRPLAEKSAWLAVQVATGASPTPDTTINNGKKDVPTFTTPVFPVDKTNLDAQIIETGFHSREAVYGK